VGGYFAGVGTEEKTMSYSPSRDREELRRNADAMLSKLALTGEVGLSDIVSRVATVSGKRIEIDPIGDRDWETVTGLVLQTDDAATILVRRSDPRWYQFHTVLHELSHVVFDHTGCATLPVRHPGHQHARAGQTVLARGVASPDFDRLVDYADMPAVMEAEAERLSQLLSKLVLRPRHGRDEAVFG